MTAALTAGHLAERMRLGLDRYDEVWEGEYHVVPAPNEEHQRIETELIVLLHPLAKAAGLHLRPEMSLFEPGVPGNGSYRTPDLIVFPDAVRVERGAEGAASMVVEIRSPRDESFAKLPFYERLGVGEVLIIDRETKEIRRWVNGSKGLVEQSPHADGRHHLACLPVRLSTGSDAGRPTLVVDTETSTTII